MKDEFYIPSVWRVQDKRNKQASVAGDLNHAQLSAELEAACQSAFDLYQALLKQGIAREMARMVLPVNTYSVVMFKMNAHALMHFIELRAAPDAQWEIQQYAITLRDEFFKPALPWVAEYFDAAIAKRREMDEALQKL
jgi:thymidylate synthase (FAD)